MPRKIYERILNERMMKITDKSVCDEQGGFRKGRGCVDQIFAVKILMEKYLEKDRKLKMNAGKNKVMVFEKKEEEVIDFNIAYKGEDTNSSEM